MRKNKKQRAKSKSFKKLLLLTLILFVATSLIPRPGTRAFKCVGDNPWQEEYTTHRDERGLPFPILKRSIYDIGCLPTDGKDMGGEKSEIVKPVFLTNPDLAHEQYEAGYFILLDIILDLIFWSFMAYGLLLLLEPRKSKRNE